MSKLSVHLTFPGNATGYGDFLRLPAESGNPVSLVYQLNSNTKADISKYSPNTKLIYRRQSEAWQRLPDDMFISNPVISCNNWMLNNRENGRNLVEMWSLNPADYYDPLNEPVIGTVAQANWLNTWMYRALEIGNYYGFKLAMFSFPVGSPDFSLWPYLFNSLRLGKSLGAILSLHAYGVEGNLIDRNLDGSLSENTLSLTLRHRKIWRLLPEDCKIPIALTEAGCGNGYAVPLTGQAYINDVIEFDKELFKDSYIISANLFQLGGSESNLQPVIYSLTNYVATTPTPEPPTSGLPYKVKVHLTPYMATWQQVTDVQKLAFLERSTVCQSADDARYLVKAGQPGSEVYIYNPTSWPDNIIKYFEGCSIVVKLLNPPSPVQYPAKKGVGMGKLGLLTSPEKSAVLVSKVNGFLALTLPDFGEAADLVRSVKVIKPDMFIAGRLFFSVDNTNKTKFNPSDFVAYCKNGLDGFYAEGVRYFQIHNEPNLESEGFGWNWANGVEFAKWLNEVLVLLRARYPEAKWGYPGLSPQPNTEVFWADSKPAMDNCDWVGVHAYWQYRGTTGWGMESLDGGYHYKRLSTTKPLMITEFSNNSPSVSDAEKGQQYKDYYQLVNIPAFCFCLSWYDDPNKEGWVRGNIITDIPREVGA